jgi:hypothetical protein
VQDLTRPNPRNFQRQNGFGGFKGKTVLEGLEALEDMEGAEALEDIEPCLTETN